jgi:hypothetical protein
MLKNNNDEVIIRLKVIINLIDLKEYNQIQYHLSKLRESKRFENVKDLENLLVSEKYFEATIWLEKYLITPKQPEEILPVINNKIESRIGVKVNGKWGFKNESNEIVIDCIYDQAFDFIDERAIVKKDNKLGVINLDGELCSSFDYDQIHRFSEGLAAVLRYTIDRKAQWGFINYEGKEVIQLKYDGVKKFSEGLGMVRLNDKIGFIDFEGNQVIDFLFSYDNSGDEFEYHNEEYVFYDGRCKVYLGNYEKDAIIKNQGNVIVSYMDYCVIKPYSEGLAAVAKKIENNNNEHGWDLIWGFIDLNGNEVIQCRFTFVGSFRDGYAPVSINRKWGYINKKGFVVIPLKYFAARHFSEGLAAVSQILPNPDTSSPYKIYKWGFIDTKGIVVIPFIHDGYTSLYEGIPLQNSFKNGIVQVKQGHEKFGKIDRNGNIVEEFRKYNYTTGEYE